MRNLLLVEQDFLNFKEIHVARNFRLILYAAMKKHDVEEHVARTF